MQMLTLLFMRKWYKLTWLLHLTSLLVACWCCYIACMYQKCLRNQFNFWSFKWREPLECCFHTHIYIYMLCWIFVVNNFKCCSFFNYFRWEPAAADAAAADASLVVWTETTFVCSDLKIHLCDFQFINFTLLS